MPLHADTQYDPLTLVGAGLDCVRKRNHSSLWAIKQRCLVPQGFQLSLYTVDILGHLRKGYATGVGLLGIVINRLSSSRSTMSSHPYWPLSPCRM